MQIDWFWHRRFSVPFTFCFQFLFFCFFLFCFKYSIPYYTYRVYYKSNANCIYTLNLFSFCYFFQCRLLLQFCFAIAVCLCATHLRKISTILFGVPLMHAYVFCKFGCLNVLVVLVWLNHSEEKMCVSAPLKIVCLIHRCFVWIH